MSANSRIRISGTDLDVSPICLGGNRFGAELDRDASFTLLDHFVEQGGNFVDTAHIYADWLPNIERSASEKTIGRWLRARGMTDRMVIATKGGHPPLDNSQDRRLDAVSLRRDALASRDNLGVEALDIFYLHRDDPKRPVAEILGSLEDLRDDGLIRHYAASNWSLKRLEEAAQIAAKKGWQGFVANQPEWSLAQRNAASAPKDLIAMDAAMFAWHKNSRVAAIPYSAQARGYFDKMTSGGLDADTAKNYDNETNRRFAAELGKVARDIGATPTQLMLSLMSKAPFPVIPVVGCRTAAQIRASFAGIHLSLPDGAHQLSDTWRNV